MQTGGYPLSHMLRTVDVEAGEEVQEKFEETDQFEESEEEYEEEFEEENEEELEEGDLLSHATSYSEFYVIDEKEEARLK